jgi:enterochelin esterase family protein
VPVIVDNLIESGKIKPLVVVFVNQANRMTELEPNDAFTQFIAGELLPYVRDKYGTSADPARNVLMGSSQGGLAANALAIARPDLFGGVISQSASLWWRPATDTAPEYFARLIARTPPKPIRFYLEVGSFEIDRTSGGQPGQVDVNRHFRDVLVAKGYDVVYSEYPGGHEYLSWRVTTPAALMHFFR